MKRTLAAAPDAAPASAGDSVATARRAHIQEAAAALGKIWADHFRRDLHREGRAASGGWPGTLREARARVGLSMTVDSGGRRGVLNITEAEREVAARTAYSSARDEWRKHAEPEPT